MIKQDLSINCPGFQAGVKAGNKSRALAHNLVAAKAESRQCLTPWLKPGVIIVFGIGGLKREYIARFNNCPGFQAGVKAGNKSRALAHTSVAAKAESRQCIIPWLKPGVIIVFGIEGQKREYLVRFNNCPGFQAGVKAGKKSRALAHTSVAAKAESRQCIIPWLKPGVIIVLRIDLNH